MEEEATSEESNPLEDTLEKLQMAGDHEERAARLKTEAKDELDKYLSEIFPSDTTISISQREGAFSVSCIPTGPLGKINSEIDDDMELVMPLEFRIGEESPSSNNGLDHHGNRERVKNVKQLIFDIEQEYDDGAPIKEVLNRAYTIGLPKSEAEHEIDKLKQKGEVYEPSTDTLRTT